MQSYVTALQTVPCSNIQLSHSVMILSPVTIEPLQIQIQKYNIEYIVFVLSSIDYMSKRISKLDLDLECSGTVHRKSKKERSVKQITRRGEKASSGSKTQEEECQNATKETKTNW